MNHPNSRSSNGLVILPVAVAAPMVCMFASMLVPATGAASPPASTETVAPPTFIPGADTKVERVYTWRLSSATESVQVLLDGEETTEVPAASTDQTSERSLTVTDTFTRSDVNRPLELTRSFDDITFEASGDLSLDSGNGMVAELSFGCDGDSDLDGVAVKFTWDADDEEYLVKYAEDYEGEDELLEPLDPDADFLALLPAPDEDVEIGATWEIEPADLRSVLLPGGAVSMGKESEMDAIYGVVDPLLMPGILDTLDGDPAGEVTAMLKSAEDGIVTIALNLEVEFESDQIGPMESLIEAAAPEDVTVEMETANFTSTLTGTGALVWDTEKNVAQSLVLELKTTLTIEIAVQVDGMGVNAPYQLNEVREGALQLEMTTEE